MARHTKEAPAKSRRALSVRSVRIEFPHENEVLSGRHYTLSIAAPAACLDVSVCIDQGEWRACRESLGLWWFDWEGFDAGEHSAVARVRMAEGTVLLSETRIFFASTGDSRAGS
ncbi:MAG: hypothetical protein HYZ75_03390 [Elusimicrobia bacterium]|nr:hypothetical protein [Elusimicrobiota bacterium]